MTKTRKQFSPHVYAEWGELFDFLTPEQGNEVLKAIVKYPNYEPKVNVPIWNFIKSQIQKDYEYFLEKCQKNGEISRNYWQNKKTENQEKSKSNNNECISKVTERLPNDIERHPELITNNELLITNNGITNNELQKTNNKKKKEYIILGAYNNIKLTEEQIIKLQELYGNLYNEAIETLSSYVESSGKKYKNFYAVLDSHNWVYKKIMNNNANNIPKQNNKELTEQQLLIRKNDFDWSI